MSAEHKVDIAIPAIEFRHVDFSYDDKKVLDDLCFQVAKGEIKIILSGSGGGKSTVLKLALGLRHGRVTRVKISNSSFALGDIQREISYIVSPD